MEIRIDGRRISAKRGENLLDCLLGNGVDIAYGCRAGACCSCRIFDEDFNVELLACQTTVERGMSLSLISTIVKPFPVVVTSVSALSNGTLITCESPASFKLGDKVQFDEKPSVWVTFHSDSNGAIFWTPNLFASRLSYSAIIKKQNAMGGKGLTVDPAFSLNTGNVLLVHENSTDELFGYIQKHLDNRELVVKSIDSYAPDLGAFKFNRFDYIVVAGATLLSLDWESILQTARVRAEHIYFLPISVSNSR